MRPTLIHELLVNDNGIANLGVSAAAIIESQSIDTRPNYPYFITLHMGPEGEAPGQLLGPRTLVVNVHHPWDNDRDYGPLDAILNAVDKVLLPIQQGVGSDGVRVSQVRRGRRSGNMEDEAWKTICRWSTYGVSYDEFAA